MLSISQENDRQVEFGYGYHVGARKTGVPEGSRVFDSNYIRRHSPPETAASVIWFQKKVYRFWSKNNRAAVSAFIQKHLQQYGQVFRGTK